MWRFEDGIQYDGNDELSEGFLPIDGQVEHRNALRTPSTHNSDFFLRPRLFVRTTMVIQVASTTK